MDSKGLQFFHSVIWDKLNPGLGLRFRRQHEMILVAHKQGGRLAWNRDVAPIPNIIAMSPPRDRVHPNEKPVALMQRLINAMSVKGDIVCDPFMGGGTTGVAAVTLCRQFIGIELDPAHFDIACRRVSDALSRPRLALDEPRKIEQRVMDL